MKTMEQEELTGSELGTKDYWDASYAIEVKNYQSHKDLGEIWFGEETMDRIIRYMTDADVDKHSSVLDIGCGNGLFLIELAFEGYTDLTGVDYADDAIRLAKMVADQKDVKVNFSMADVMCDFGDQTSLHPSLQRQYDVCHDKGTYDAISLSPHQSAKLRNRYLDSVFDLLRPGGFFIITSCNWTTNELVHHMQSRLILQRVIPTPQFSFGGSTGNLVSSLVFRKPL